MATTKELVIEAFKRLGNKTAVADELGILRQTVQYHLRDLSAAGRAGPAGRITTTPIGKRPMPKKGVKRYILTSAQNNTKVNEGVWKSLLTLAAHYDAELLIGTYSYNLSAYGEMATKRGHAGEGDNSHLWYDHRLMPYIEAGDDQNIELAPGLIWCGRANILPTAQRPLSGFESYTHRSSGIFPHAKMAMDSIASGKYEPTKFNYTTGTVTQRNYIQKKAGMKAEHHHTYGALLVEIHPSGRWYTRQLNADSKSRICDFTLMANGEELLDGQRLEGIGWGDIHEAKLDPIVRKLAWGKGGMLDVLRPKYQFMHDLVDFKARRHHDTRDPHIRYKKFIEGYESVESEMGDAATFLEESRRDWCRTIVVDSNHDNDFERWLRETDYRTDSINAEYFLEAQLKKYQSIRERADFHSIEWAMQRANCHRQIKFLRQDESFIMLKEVSGGIEAGHHGHLGVNGARPSPTSFAKTGRKINNAHSHSAGIHDGTYTSGLSGLLDQGYNKGLSSWSQSHVLTYFNAKRAIVTMWDGDWRA